MSKSTNKKELDGLTHSLDRLKIEKVSKRGDSPGSALNESVEEYTEKELKYLDRYKEVTGSSMDDEELYDIIIRHNFNDRKISEEIQELQKLVKNKGEEYGWTKIEKGKKAKVEKTEESAKPTTRGNNREEGYKSKYKGKRDGTNYSSYSNYRKNYTKNIPEGGETQNAQNYQNYQNYHNQTEDVQENQVAANEGYPTYTNYGYTNNYRSYSNDDYGKNYNNYESNYGYSAYKPRGRGFYSTRGATNYSRGRGRGRYRTNYYDDALYQREVQLGDKQELGKVEEESQNEKMGAHAQGHEQNYEEEPEENFLEENETPHTNKKEDLPLQIKESSIPSQVHSIPIHNLLPKYDQRENTIDTINNIFNSKDIPSNIRSNIKNLIDETEPEVSQTSNQKTGFNNLSVNTHSHSTHGNTTGVQNNNLNNNSTLPRRFEEFSVQSSSMSISHVPQNMQRDIGKQGTNQNPNLNTTNINFQAQNQTTSQPTSNINAPFRDTRVENKKVTTQKKNENPMGGQPTTGGNQEYPPTYNMPWAMNPMLYYQQQGGQPMQGVPTPGYNFDPNSQGTNPMYPPMMPMYYLPPGYAPQEEDNSSKTKRTGRNEMAPGMQGGLPPYAPFFYYNNPYMMGMPGYNFPGMNMQGMSPNIPNEGQNFYEGMKNTKNSNEEPNPNFYYNNPNYYKQG